MPRRRDVGPEVADAVAWVLSERAAYVHGAEIAVDGGITSVARA